MVAQASGGLPEVSGGYHLPEVNGGCQRQMMGTRGKWWASSMSVLGARQMVSGGVEWQVAEANGVQHRQMVGAGGKRWEFKLKVVEANGGQWM